MGDGGSGSESLLPPWDIQVKCPHKMHSTTIFISPGGAEQRLSPCSRVFGISPRQGDKVKQNLADGEDQLLK